MADIIVETDRLILRTIDEGDAVEQMRLLNTPTVMARLGGPKELHEIEAKHAEPGLYQRTRNIGGRFRVFGARETVCEDSPRSWQSVWFIKPCSQQMAEAPGKFNFKASHVSLKLIRMQDSNRGRCDSKIRTRNLFTRQRVLQTR